MKKPISSPRPAFTLIELLVVMGIIVLMGALVVPAVSGTLKGTALNQAAQTIQAQFNAAQQNALAKGQTVEMRLIMCGDPDSPTVDKESDKTFKLRGIQLYAVTANTDVSTVGTQPQKFTPITKLEFLPNTVVIDRNLKLSSLCDSTLLVDLNSKEYYRPKLPRVGTNYKYYHIQFRADGSTNLMPNQQWFLTIHNATNPGVSVNDADNLTTPPSNFFTISLDPVQGSNRAFRPS